MMTGDKADLIQFRYHHPVCIIQLQVTAGYYKHHHKVLNTVMRGGKMEAKYQAGTLVVATQPSNPLLYATITFCVHGRDRIRM